MIKQMHKSLAQLSAFGNTSLRAAYQRARHDADEWMAGTWIGRWQPQAVRARRRGRG